MRDYDGLPEGLREGARLWIERGVAPGNFLCAVIRNDLREAFAWADGINLARLHDIVRWWYNEAPISCWGNAERFNTWQGLCAPAHAGPNERASGRREDDRGRHVASGHEEETR